MRLLVVSHTAHFRTSNGEIVGWGPTIREVDHLAGLFDEVIHVAPLHPGNPPKSSLPYASTVVLRAVRPTGGTRLRDKLDVLCKAPHYVRAIRKASRQADVVHIRCPANISLFALLFLIVSKRPKFRWAKYAGTWKARQRKPISYALQAFILMRRLHRGITTVNGRWRPQPSHVYTLLNPCLTEEEVIEGQQAGVHKTLGMPVRLLFVGRVESVKGFDRVVRVAESLSRKDIDFRLDVVGGGPEQRIFEDVVVKAGLAPRVIFHGWLPRTNLGWLYSEAHLLVHPSSSEGWPKVVSEAMAYGAVPLVGAVPAVQQFFSEIPAGIALPPSDVEGFVRSIEHFIGNRALWKHTSEAALEAATAFSYQRYLLNVAQLFEDAWGIRLPVDRHPR